MSMEFVQAGRHLKVPDQQVEVLGKAASMVLAKQAECRGSCKVSAFFP
jgi:hypothetical protein